MLTQRYCIRIACFVAVCLAILALPLSTSAHSLYQENSQSPSAEASYPADPPSDVPWSANYGGVSDVAAAFNYARERENEALGSSLASIALPSAATWQQMSSAQKALWLVNDERVVRGLKPLHGLEENVNDVAQGYADWLLANNKFDHDADGRSPWDRLDANATIDACHDFLGIAENLYFQATTGSESIPLVIEQAVYMMLYDDAGSQWGHRHAILWTPYTENSGAPDREGFLGIGHAHGGFTNPYDGDFYQNTDIIVMNFFDPCQSWVEETPVTPSPSPSPSPSATSPTPSPTPDETATPTPEPEETPIPPTRTVSGRITEAVTSGDSQRRNGIAGVTITSDDGQTTVTDEDGEFTLTGLSLESHILTPSKEGYAFSPSSIVVDASQNDLFDIDFTGSSGPSGTDFSFSLHLPLITPRR